MKPKFQIHNRRNTPVIDFTSPIGVKDTVSILLQFDEHWDNPHSNQELIGAHMKEAVEGGWPIIKGGDSLCLMQGRYDPRRSRNDIRPEHDHADYIDRIVSSYAEFCKPAAKNIAFMGRGNHELSILRHLETDVIERVCERLRVNGSDVRSGGIGGWIIVQVWISKTARLSIPIFYTHGYGGGGPVTRGVIQTNRRGVVYGDARVIITGHIHEEWAVTICRDRLCVATGKTFQDEQLHINSATYKDEYDPVNSSWHSQMGRPPKPVGGTWLDISLSRDTCEQDRGDNGKLVPHYKTIINARRAK